MVELRPSEYEELRKLYSADEVDELAGQCRDTNAFWALLAERTSRTVVWELQAAAGQRRTRD